MGARGRIREAELDRLRALLLMADALRAGNAERARAAEAPLPRPGRPASTGTRDAFEVDVSHAAQRLHLRLSGFIDAAQARAFLAEVQRALGGLQPGFDVLSDVSRLGTVTADAHPVLRRVATALVEAGMRQMVRAVGGAPAGATAVVRASEGLYRARVVASAAEAARLLDASLNSGRIATPPSPLDPRTARRKALPRKAPAAGHTARVRR
jgi:hypothetical protein